MVEEDISRKQMTTKMAEEKKQSHVMVRAGIPASVDMERLKLTQCFVFVKSGRKFSSSVIHFSNTV